MATETEQLVVTLEARIDAFEKNFQKANRTANSQFGAIEARGRQAAARLDQSFSLSATNVTAAFSRMSGMLGIGSLIGGASLAAGLSTIKSVAADLAKIGKTADAVGLATERLQQLRYASEQAAGSTEAVDSGMKRFAQNVAEAAAGGGELLKVLQANGIALRDSQGNLRSTNDLFLQFSNLVRGARTPADQLRLAVRAFGEAAGADLVGLLRGGSAEIERLAAEATKTGAVIQNELVRKGQELDDKFAAITSTVSTKLKSAVIEVVDAVKEFMELLSKLSGGEVPMSKLAERSLEITREIIRLEGDLDDARNTASQTGLSLDRERVRFIEQRIAALQAEDRTLIARGQAAGDERMKPAAPLPPATNIPTATGTDSKNAFETEQARLSKRIQLLAAETASLGQNTAERERARASVELMHAAQQAGIPINEKVKAKIDELSRQWGDAAERAESAKDRFEAIQGAAREFGSAVTDAFKGMVLEGESLNAVLATMLSRLASKAFDHAFELLLNGSSGGGSKGLLGGIFGALFGGARADGGPVSPDRAYLVGERGPEIMLPGVSGSIIPNHALGQRSFAQTNTNTFNVTVAGSGGSPEQNNDLVEKMSAALHTKVEEIAARSIRQQMRPGGLLAG